MAQNKFGQGLLLKRDKVDFSGGILVYELRSVGTRDGFLLSVTAKLEGESCTCLFAARFVEVLKLYKLIVKNTVTPCTLEDVVEDYKNQHIFDEVNS